MVLKFVFVLFSVASGCFLRVVSISEPTYRYKDNLPGRGNKGNSDALWFTQRNAAVANYKERLGIEVGETNILVHVKVLIGQKYVYMQNGRMQLEKQWANAESCYPLQAVVRNLEVHDVMLHTYETIQALFPMGSNCFMIGHPHYGSMGEVIDNVSLKSGRLKVRMQVYPEPDLSTIYQYEQEIKYMPAGILAQRLAISPHLLSRITGSVLVVLGHKRNVLPRNANKLNVGLNLKYNKKNEEIPGYSKRVEGQWLYSHKALHLVAQYMEFCPELFSCISSNVGFDIFYESDLFPDEVGFGRVQILVDWLKNHPYSSIERRKIGSETVEQEVVKKLEEIIDDFNSKLPNAKRVIMQVKSHLLYKPESQTSYLPPDPTVTFKLYDRVVNIRESYTVPFGCRGTIIGIIADKKEMNDQQDIEETFDILFDEPFAGGIQLNCLSKRGYRLPKAALINISHGQRLLEEKSVNAVVSNQWFTRNQTDHQQINNQSVQSQNSAFASWCPPNSSNFHSHPQPQPMFIPPQIHHTQNAPFAKHINHHPHKRIPVRPQQQVQGPTTEYQAFFKDLQKNHTKPALLPTPGNHLQSTPVEKPSIMGLPSPQVAQNIHTQNKPSTPSKSESQQIQQGAPDETEVLKKLLNISEKPKELSLTDQTVTPPLSVQDFFAHARSKGQHLAQSSKPVSYYSIQLLNYCQAQRIGVPRYTYMNFDNGIRAQINLPDGRVIVGEEASDKETATENAAKMFMGNILNNEIITSKQPNYQQHSYSSPDASSGFPAPPKLWWNNVQLSRHDKRNVKSNQNTAFNNKQQHINKTQNGSHISTKQVTSVNENKLAPQTPFVPLQAVKQQRSKSVSSGTETVENHKKEDTVTQRSPKNTATENKTKDVSITQLNVLLQPAGNATIQQNKVRKSRIAANFSALQSK